MNQVDGSMSKAAASLFILALCDREDVEEHKHHVAQFCKGELINLIINEKSADKLVRFRAIWIVETYSMFLEVED